MNKKEKIVKLEEVVKVLKQEFIGLDDILDEIKNQIITWYVTPEVLSRPVVISLWGMTGTGKSSVVRRLVELLNLENETLNFDCGEYCSDRIDSLGTTLLDVLGKGDSQYKDSTTYKAHLVFVWDEFQHARTIDESGIEVDKPQLRSVWSLLDNGIVSADDNDGNWDYAKLQRFIDDFIPFSEQYPDITVTRNNVTDKKKVKIILDEIGLSCYPDRSLTGLGITLTGYRYKFAEKSSEDKNSEELLVLPEDIIFSIIKFLGKDREKNVRAFLRKPNKTFGEIGKWLKEVKNNIIRPKSINCSNSLVFVIGNLDEAFKVDGELNPDLDADTFNRITEKVSITDIKEALKTRFRPEQIARLGNGLIKYPTLSKQSFKKIIRNETKRIIDKFKELDDIEVVIDEKFYDLIYSEGVYPTQGVRPVFTTIGHLLTPNLSRILIENEDHKHKKVVISYEGDLNSKAIKITLDFDGMRKEYEQPLQLGKIRNPRDRKRRYAIAVHEIGHAILQSYQIGIVPDLIVSVSSDGGGFCDAYNKDTEGEISSVEDINDDVMISLGGYVAEKLTFASDKILLGSGSDLESAWKSLSDAVYKNGHSFPMIFSNYNTENSGISSIPSGFSDTQIQSTIKAIYSNLHFKTEKVIMDNKKLLAKAAMALSEKGSMTGEEFTEFIKKYGKTLTLEDMKKTKELKSPNYYENTIKSLL